MNQEFKAVFCYIMSLKLAQNTRNPVPFSPPSKKSTKLPNRDSVSQTSRALCHPCWLGQLIGLPKLESLLQSEKLLSHLVIDLTDKPGCNTVIKMSLLQIHYFNTKRLEATHGTTVKSVIIGCCNERAGQKSTILHSC